MTGDLENVRERVQAVEHKVDALAVSVDARFNAVDEALLEQRQYTEFAFDRLSGNMRADFYRIDKRFDGVEEHFVVLKGRFEGLEGHFNRLERKLDRFIESQSRANDLVERRLRALEPRSDQE
jgi:hypothetical protein